MLSQLSGGGGGRGGRGGFSSGLNTSAANDTGRVVSARMNRQASGVTAPSLTSSPSQPSAFDGIEFYYMTTSDDQVGPADLKELRTKFKTGEFSQDCFYWYEGMGGWEALESNQALLKKVNPPPPPPKKGAAPAEPAAAHPPAPPRPTAPARAKGSTMSAPEGASTHAPRKKVLEKGWMEKLTADLVPYYYNTATGVLQWEKPSELLGGSAKATGNSGWVWVPDEEEGYAAARSLGGTTYQTMDGRSINYKPARGVTLDPLNQVSHPYCDERSVISSPRNPVPP